MSVIGKKNFETVVVYIYANEYAYLLVRLHISDVFLRKCIFTSKFTYILVKASNMEKYTSRENYFSLQLNYNRNKNLIEGSMV